ncbi:class I SAM-dependent methyltransferase [Patescibacteria group bacterium]|nr:MAG: class I SAM-dependent methyltransferase [Patescibacteria group bacterium]
MPAAPPTSWENVADWYGKHQEETGTLLASVVYPGALKLLAPKSGASYLDVACGEGAFSRLVAARTKGHVSGFDAAPSLIAIAKKQALKHAAYAIADARAFSKLYPLNSFDGATCLLAIQNIDEPGKVFQEASKALKPAGTFVVVMNHPAFRVPGASSWGYEGNAKMFRRVDRYLSALEIPIQAHPGTDPTVKTVSYHRPISSYVNALADAGFAVTRMEEWTSNRVSKPGARAKAENLSRKEIPMFLAIKATKV